MDLLCELGANITSLLSTDANPLDVARERKHRAVVQKLQTLRTTLRQSRLPEQQAEEAPANKADNQGVKNGSNDEKSGIGPKTLEWMGMQSWLSGALEAVSTPRKSCQQECVTPVTRSKSWIAAWSSMSSGSDTSTDASEGDCVMGQQLGLDDVV